MRRGSRGAICWLAAFAVLSALALFVGCQEPTPKEPIPPPNVVIVVADALRPDRLGAYGSSRGLSPFLDSVAERAYVFRHAYTPAPWTAPALGALFTSRYPTQLGIASFRSVLHEDETTLAEVLRERGYSTAAFLSHWFLVGRGLDQGFDVYGQGISTSGAHKERGPELNERVFEWFDQRPTPGQPVFLYLHYSEPHVPYSPPAATLQRFSDGGDVPDLERLNRLISGPRRPPGGLSAEQMRQVTAAYDAEVASLDHSIGELFGGLEARGVLQHAVVVVTADHAESFQEHGAFGHANSLFEHVIRVPLLVVVPDLSTRLDVAQPASLIDVAPTLLDLSAIEVPGSFEGRSLLSAMRGAADWLAPLRALWRGPGPPVFSERAADFGRSVRPEHERTVVIGRQKYIAARGHPGEFYDLRRDPGERSPQALKPAGRDRLQRAMEEHTRRLESRRPPGQGAAFGAETRERLRALGYGEQ